MVNFSSYAEVIKIKSIPGASFKPLSGAQVMEVNGCYSNVSYIGFNLPIGSALIGVKLIAVDTVGKEKIRLSVAKSNSAIVDGFQIDSMVDLKPLNVIKYISASPPYIVQENDFFTLHFTRNKSNTVKMCGVKVYYLTDPASELIFYNSFE